MKIGFLTPEYPHHQTGSSGGIGTSIKNLSVALIEKGHTVVIFVYKQKEDGFFFDDTIKVVQLKNVLLKGFSWYFTRKKLENIINKFIGRHEIDILEVADWTGISAFMKIDCPVVMRLHGSDTFFCSLDNRSVKAWNKYLEKKAFENADAVIAVSKFVAEKSNILFALQKPFTVIHNGVDATHFNNIEAVKNEGQLLYFGTLVRKKGVLELPHIFNKVLVTCPNATLVLAGADSPDIPSSNDSTWGMMKSLFDEQALQRVNYAGKIPYTKIRKYIEQATVCIFPSFAEACPVSWLEAMAMGKAIVASDIGWAQEMILDNFEGFLVNPKNHEMFAERIVELLSDKNLNRSMGNAAVKRVEKDFSNKQTAEQTIKFYSSVLSKSN